MLIWVAYLFTAYAFMENRKIVRNLKPPKIELVIQRRVDSAILIDLTLACLNSGASVPRTLMVLGKTLAGSDSLSRANISDVASVNKENLSEINKGQIKSLDSDIADDLQRAARSLLLGAPWQEAWAEASARLDPLQEALEPAWCDGASPGPILERTADRIRRSRVRVAKEDAQRIGVKLALPLGICFLPAFVFLGILPLVVTLAGAIFTTN